MGLRCCKAAPNTGAEVAGLVPELNAASGVTDLLRRASFTDPLAEVIEELMMYNDRPLRWHRAK